MKWEMIDFISVMIDVINGNFPLLGPMQDPVTCL